MVPRLGVGQIHWVKVDQSALVVPLVALLMLLTLDVALTLTLGLIHAKVETLVGGTCQVEAMVGTEIETVAVDGGQGQVGGPVLRHGDGRV